MNINVRKVMSIIIVMNIKAVIEKYVNVYYLLKEIPIVY